LEDDMAYASPAYRRVLCRDLEVLEAELELTAVSGRPSPWIERLRERVRKVRERMEIERRER
jgi:hypothetical protein